jgi:iron complex outermembrane receptor protein
MFKRTKVCSGVLSALGGTLMLSSLPVLAQQAPAADSAPPEQRVEITGSSIKRIATESALPVQTYTAEDIAKTGATSVTDLIQNIPAMQGFLTASQSINGGGGGATNASLHALGAQYTLVLLNGRRMAPYNTGGTVNLNSLPLAAIERIEVLTDGASALYGSDAIAGVVNFITKKDSTEGLATVAGYAPQHPGGGSATASISKGFGDLARDKFNVLVSASFDKQQKLDASQRTFSKSGTVTFYDQGQLQGDSALSSNSVPANIPSVTLANGTVIRNFNVYLLNNGACPAGETKSGKRCLYDYPATVEDIPASKRASLFTSGRYQPNDNFSIFSELAISRFENDPRYAAPAQPGLPLSAALLAKDINPLLPSLGAPAGQTAVKGTMNLRLYDAGGRQDKYQYDATHFVLGADATLGKVDLTGSYTHSQTKFSDTAEGGYSSLNAFNALIASGTWDPLTALPGTSANLVAPIVLHQVTDSSKSSIDVVSGRASTSLGKLEGGSIGLGAGADLTVQKYVDNPSAIAQGKNALQPNYTDAIVGGSGGALPFDSSRNSYGVFGEAQLPVLKELEFDASARYDSYDAVKNSQNFDQSGNPVGSATQGKKSSSGTYKLSFKITPSKDLLLRGSVGTGFKAPSLSEITSPLQSGGSTGFHACPPGLSAAKAAYCGPISQEYNIQSGGNPASDSGALKPEKSSQWTIGFRFEPTPAISFGADLWTVQIKDQINSVTENTAFSNGAQYDNLFKILPDPVTGTPTLTYLNVPINTGSAYYQGVDVDAESRINTAIGKLTTHARATWMLRADYQTPGTPGYINSLAKIGLDGTVVFRYLINVTSSLQTGRFTNTLAVSYKPRYMDDTTDYCRTDASGNCLLTLEGDPQGRYVGGYFLMDWQTKYAFTKTLSATFGIKNIADKAPPFTLLDQGGTGNARWYDGRYTDPIGRQFYLGANYIF